MSFVSIVVWIFVVKSTSTFVYLLLYFRVFLYTSYHPDEPLIDVESIATISSFFDFNLSNILLQTLPIGKHI